jgi:hypothetical protein
MTTVWFQSSYVRDGERIWLELDLAGWRNWVREGVAVLDERLRAAKPSVFEQVEVWWVR